MNPRARLKEIREEATAIVKAAKAQSREHSDAERKRLDEIFEEAPKLQKQIDRLDEDKAVVEKVNEFARKLGHTDDGGPDDRAAKALPAKVRGAGRGDWSKSWRDAQGTKSSLLAPNSVPVTVPMRGEPVRDGQPVLSLRQVLPTEANSGGHYSFLRQTQRDNNARTVAKGTVKPTSSYQLERIDGRVKVIAHLSDPIDQSDLSDADALWQFVDAELRLGYEEALEHEIIHGDGSSSGGTDRMVGLLETSGIQLQAFDESAVRTVRRSLTKLETLGLQAGAIVLSPQSWEDIELAAGEHSDFVLDREGGSLPIDRAARRLWGVPVVVTSRMDDAEAITLDASSVRLHVRQEAQMAVTDSPVLPEGEGFVSGFATNQVQFRVEGRADIEVSRPVGVVKVALTNGAG